MGRKSLIISRGHKAHTALSYVLRAKENCTKSEVGHTTGLNGKSFNFALIIMVLAMGFAYIAFVLLGHFKNLIQSYSNQDSMVLV